MVQGGTTWVRLKCVNGQQPALLARGRELLHRRGRWRRALYGTSGSRVSRSRDQLERPEHAEAADLADARVPLGELAQPGADDVVAERAGVLDDALLARRSSIDATADAHASGCPE